jgi:hypothetical protein
VAREGAISRGEYANPPSIPPYHPVAHPHDLSLALRSRDADNQVSPADEFAFAEDLPSLRHITHQVFFIDSTGALCSRASGHAIDVDGEPRPHAPRDPAIGLNTRPGEELVLRHRRPISYPFPNEFSHPLPQFSYDRETQQISISFSYPPNFSNSSENWAEDTYLLASKPRVRPKSVVEHATAFFSTAVTSSMSLISGVGHNKPTPDQVFEGGEIDLRDDEILDLDRGEEGEVDDSPDLLRLVRVVTISPTDYDKTVARYKALRRKWELLPLRAARLSYHARRPSTASA